jgi:hypothetical protein
MFQFVLYHFLSVNQPNRRFNNGEGAGGIVCCLKNVFMLNSVIA